MQFSYTIYRPDGSHSDHTIDWPAEPDYKQLEDLLNPLIGCQWFEHVSVRHNGERRDMFVDETGALTGLPWNEAATAIYRANWLHDHPGTDPKSLAAIYGVAVLFPNQIVWM